jgi:hypothetical protein
MKVKTNTGWILKIQNNSKLLTNNIITELKNLDKSIYFNNTTGKYWMFDFNINGVWFEALNIDCYKKYIVLNAYC